MKVISLSLASTFRVFNAYDLLISSRNQLFLNQEKKDKKVEEKEEKKDDELVAETTMNNTDPILLITQNIPEFIGTDTKKYFLRKNDVVVMPQNMGEMLVKRKKAEEINC